MRPAHPLFIEFFECAGSNRVDVSFVAVLNLEVVLLHAQGDLHVFGVVRVAEKPNLFENFSAINGEWSGGNVNCVQIRKRLLEHDANLVLNVLRTLDHGLRFEYFDGRRDSHDFRFVKIPDHSTQGVFVNKRVGVQATDEVSFAVFNAIVQCGIFSAVFFYDFFCFLILA